MISFLQIRTLTVWNNLKYNSIGSVFIISMLEYCVEQPERFDSYFSIDSRTTLHGATPQALHNQPRGYFDNENTWGFRV